MFRLLSYTTEDHLSRGGTSHSGRGPPISILSQENAPQLCPRVNLMETIPQVRVLLESQVTLVCVKLTKANQPTGKDGLHPPLHPPSPGVPLHARPGELVVWRA